MKLDRVLRELVIAAGGDAAELAAGLTDAHARSGMIDAETPPVLLRALEALARGVHPAEAHDGETGFWLLQDYADLIPSAYVIDEPGVEGLTVAALGRSLISWQDPTPAWEVVVWPRRP